MALNRTRQRGRPPKKQPERITEIPALHVKFNDQIKQKEQREERTISIREISYSTGIYRQRLAALSKGDWSRVQLDELAALLEYFGCSIHELVQPQQAKTKDCPGVAP